MLASRRARRTDESAQALDFGKLRRLLFARFLLFSCARPGVLCASATLPQAPFGPFAGITSRARARGMASVMGRCWGPS